MAKGSDTNTKGYRDPSIKGFSKRWGISSRTTYNELGSGRLKGVKIGRRTIIPPEYEDEWADSLPPAYPEPT
jgi:hypothetical protein